MGYLNTALPVILGQSCLLSVGGYGYFHLFILLCSCIVFAACIGLGCRNVTFNLAS